MRTILLSAGALLLPTLAFAQEATTAQVATSEPAYWGLAITLVGAAFATILPCIGSILGVGMVGQAGAGLLTEKPALAGKVITLNVLPGSQGLYGMVISLLFIFNYATLLSGKVAISTTQGWALFGAFLPVMIACLVSAIYQAKVCVGGLHMLAKDEKLAGRAITMAALVETYALLGFLISFFMLNSMKEGILG